MDMTKHKPRVGTDAFRLLRYTLHCINLCRHEEDVEFVSYLGRLGIRDRSEVYGRTLAWLADHSYERYNAVRHLVWASGLKTCHVESEGPDEAM